MPQPRTRKTPKKGIGPTGAPTERPAWPDRFLVALRDCGTVAGAAQVVKIGRTTVYAEMARNPQFKADVQAIQDECVELVEATLFQQAMDPDKTTDRIFFLKTHKPEKYAERLNPQQVADIQRQARAQALREIEDEIAALPEGPRKILTAAMAEAARRKELAP